MGLGKYIARRVLLAILMLFFLLTIVFIVMHVIPGDPVRAIYGSKVSEEFVQMLRVKFSLDKPLHIQFINYFLNIFRGDLGVSIHTNRPVVVEIAYAFPVTLELTTFGMALSAIMGIPLGVISALKRDKLPDYSIRIFTILGYSLPVFMLGQILQFILGKQLSLFPIAGRYNPRQTIPSITHSVIIDTIITGDLYGLVDSLHHLFLPSLSLAVYGASIICRISRANMIEVLQEDYILTARAKGLKERIIIYKHALRNAILPVFTIVGLWFAILLGGSVLIENIFSLPGMGKLLMDSIFRRDYMVIQGCVVMTAIAVVVVTTIVDIFYAILNPRIRY